MPDIRLYGDGAPLFITPSVSPVFLNNPAFTYFEIDNKEITNMKFVHFDLNQTTQSAAPSVKVTKLKMFGLKTIS